MRQGVRRRHECRHRPARLLVRACEARPIKAGPRLMKPACVCGVIRHRGHAGILPPLAMKVNTLYAGLCVIKHRPPSLKSFREFWEFLGVFCATRGALAATSRDVSRFFASVAVSCMCVLLHPSHTTTSHSDVSHSRFIKKEMKEMDRLSEINERNGPFIKKMKTRRPTAAVSRNLPAHVL